MTADETARRPEAATVTSRHARHLADLRDAVDHVECGLGVIRHWADLLHRHLDSGGRLLTAGNGGSAAQAEHLAAELVVRFDIDRPAFDARSLTSDGAVLTAAANDLGADRIFARQVEAAAHPGDILLVLSTSGRSRNVLEAAETAHRVGARVWALTGPLDNPCAALADSYLAFGSGSTAVVQEAHLLVIHLLCEAFDTRVVEGAGTVPS